MLLAGECEDKVGRNEAPGGLRDAFMPSPAIGKQCVEDFNGEAAAPPVGKVWRS